MGRAASQNRACLSGWTEAEIASALAQKERSGRITFEDRTRALNVWHDLSHAIRRPDVVPGDFTRAMQLVDSGRRGLRAGDALHLAVTIRSGFNLATFDRDLADAAQAEGVTLALAPPT